MVRVSSAAALTTPIQASTHLQHSTTVRARTSFWVRSSLSSVHEQCRLNTHLPRTVCVQTGHPFCRELSHPLRICYPPHLPDLHLWLLSACTGCTDPIADYFRSIANMDDGSCTYTGCLDATKLNFNPSATAAGECIDKLPGCMDPTALNYNPHANSERANL